jgi:hypothetical protein
MQPDPELVTTALKIAFDMPAPIKSEFVDFIRKRMGTKGGKLCPSCWAELQKYLSR